jgi:hypothetical protein
VILALSSLVFGGAGLVFLLHPEALVGFVDLALPTATAASDVRSIFGGLELGIGLVLGVCALRRGWLHPGLAVQIAGFGGLTLGRVTSLALDGWPSAVGLALAAAEIAGLVFGLAAAWSLWRSDVDVPSSRNDETHAA